MAGKNIGIIALLSFLAIFLLVKSGARRKAPASGLGDIDGDGYVTSKDVALVKQYLSGNITLSADQLSRADVNGDGRITIVDALTIGQYAARQISDFPGG